MKHGKWKRKAGKGPEKDDTRGTERRRRLNCQEATGNRDVQRV